MALRRQVKNVVKNFTEVEVKVREATSNDPWGPSSSLMSEIADNTYNVQAFTEIMTMLWRRLNDHGKNWRHVYKALVVLDYIVKTGSERVAQQCRENIFAIQTLKDFQFIDKDGKDQGINVREKSKALVSLLKDDERLKGERGRALKAKERFSQSQGGIGNTSFPKNKRFTATPSNRPTEASGSMDDTHVPYPSRLAAEDRNFDSRSTDGRIESELEKVRPSNEAEEEMQLQIALAMSREEAEQEEKGSESDQQRLRLAVSQSQSSTQPQAASTLLNLNDPAPPPPQSNAFDPWMQQPPSYTPTQQYNDPWGTPSPPVNNMMPPMQSSLSSSLPASNPWGAAPPSAPVPAPAPVPATDPWGSSAIPSQPQVDPWASSTIQPVASIASDPFAPQSSISNGFDPRGGGAPQQSMSAPTANLFDLSDMNSELPQASKSANPAAPQFLSDVSHLVDMDNILTTPQTNSTYGGGNPFLASSAESNRSTNPFLQDKPKPKSINEIRDKSSSFVSTSPTVSGDILLPAPLIPTANLPTISSGTNMNNPFL